MKTQTMPGVDAKYATYFKLKSFYEMTEGKQPQYPALVPRSGYSADQAIGFVEGAMNLVYTDPGLTWKDYEHRIDTFELVLNSGVATEQAVEDLFNEVRDTASVFFYSISETDKFPYLYDVINITESSSLLTLSVHSIIGKVHRDPAPFGSTDYWSVFVGGGHCYPMSGGTGNASDRLNEVLNDWYAPYGCYVFTKMTEVLVDEFDLDDYNWFAENSNDPNPGDFILDYRTFYVECNEGNGDCATLANNGVFCLDPDEMNYYFQSIRSIYDDYSIHTGLSHKMSNIGLTTVNGNPKTYYWGCNNYFAVKEDCFEEGEYPYVLPFCCN